VGPNETIEGPNQVDKITTQAITIRAAKPDAPAPLNTVRTSTSRTVQGYFGQVSLTMVKSVTVM
jgi:hypothetical protein